MRRCSRQTGKGGRSGRRKAVRRAVVRMAVALRHTDLPALRDRQECTVLRCRADYWKRTVVGTILTRDYPQRGKHLPGLPLCCDARRRISMQKEWHGGPQARQRLKSAPRHLTRRACVTPSCRSAAKPLTHLGVIPLENCGGRSAFASFAAPETRRQSCVQQATARTGTCRGRIHTWTTEEGYRS